MSDEVSEAPVESQEAVVEAVEDQQTAEKPEVDVEAAVSKAVDAAMAALSARLDERLPKPEKVEDPEDPAALLEVSQNRVKELESALAERDYQAAVRDNAEAAGVRALRDETARTADMKQRAWRSALKQLFSIMVAQQVAIFGGSVKPESIEVEFADTENVDTTELSATVSTLLGAGAISLLTAVRMLHPAWDEAQVAEEVEAIEGRKSEPVVNPLMSNPLGVSLSGDIESSSSAQSIEENTNE